VLNFRVETEREANMPDRRRVLELALKGLQAERATIDDEIMQIKSQLNGLATGDTTSAVSATAAAPKKKRMSAAARRKISEGQKRRYAELNKAAPKATEPKSASRLTAAGRKKLSDLMKKRWAERRKGKTK
jgi:hypothetical protein